MTFTLINDPKGLDRKITALGKSGAKFSATLHELAYNYLMAAENTGDIRPMIKLHGVLNHANAEALRFWACDFGKFNYSTKDAKFTHTNKKTTRGVDAEAISPLDYYRMKKPAQKKAVTLKSILEAAIAKARKIEASGPAFDELLKARSLVA